MLSLPLSYPNDAIIFHPYDIRLIKHSFLDVCHGEWVHLIKQFSLPSHRIAPCRFQLCYIRISRPICYSNIYLLLARLWLPSKLDPWIVLVLLESRNDRCNREPWIDYPLTHHGYLLRLVLDYCERNHICLDESKFWRHKLLSEVRGSKIHLQ